MRLLLDLFEYAEAKNLLAVGSIFTKIPVGYRLELPSGVGASQLVKLPKNTSIEMLAEKTITAGFNSYALRGSPEFVFGKSKASTKTKDAIAQQGRAAKRFESFWHRTEQILEDAGDVDALRAVRASRENTTWAEMARQCDDETIALALGEEYLLGRPLVRAYFLREFAATVAIGGGGDDDDDVCLASGLPCTAVKGTHTDIRGVPGTEAPTALITFNDPTSRRRDIGKLQGANFPIAVRFMEGYTAALNSIVADSLVRISDTISMVVWVKPIADAIPEEASKSISQVVDAWSKNDACKAAWERIKVMATSEAELHILFLKGSKKRVAILHYDTVAASDAATSMLRFHRYFGPRSIQQKLRDTGLVFKDDKRQIVDAVGRMGIVRALLLGGTIPDHVRDEMLLGLTIKDSEGRVGAQKIVEDSPHARAILDWYQADDLWSSNDTPGGNMSEPKPKQAQSDDEPRLEDFVVIKAYTGDERGARWRRAAYLLGRLLAMEQSFKMLAHRRRLSDSSATCALNLAWTNPAAWVSEFTHHMTIYEAKMGRRWHSHKIFNEVVQDCLEQFRAPELDFLAQVRPLKLDEQAALSMGYLDQRNFNRRYRSWRHAKYQAMRAQKEAGAKVSDDDLEDLTEDEEEAAE